MIIPANEKIGKELTRLPLSMMQLVKYLDFIAEVHCDENLLVYEVHNDHIIMDIPTKSSFNGVIKLMSVMNVAWFFDKHDLHKEVLKVVTTPRGDFLMLRRGPNTTDMHPANRPTYKKERINA